MLPKISVITPSFNQAPFLEETLLSVVRQEYPNLEFIVIDGGSSDCSVDLIRKYENKIDYWVSEPDGGHTFGLVKGFARATGEILCWLNSDDVFEPGALLEVGQYFAAHPEEQAVYGDALWIDIHGRVIRSKKEHSFSRFIWMYDYNYIPQPSTFWKREIYDAVGGLDTSFRLAFDADLWIRFADVASLRHVPRVWSRMRLYREQRNQKFREISNREDEAMRRRYCGQESMVSRKAKNVIAKALRVAWKATTGCYW